MEGKLSFGSNTTASSIPSPTKDSKEFRETPKPPNAAPPSPAIPRKKARALLQNYYSTGSPIDSIKKKKDDPFDIGKWTTCRPRK